MKTAPAGVIEALSQALCRPSGESSFSSLHAAVGKLLPVYGAAFLDRKLEELASVLDAVGNQREWLVIIAEVSECLNGTAYPEYAPPGAAFHSFACCVSCGKLLPRGELFGIPGEHIPTGSWCHFVCCRTSDDPGCRTRVEAEIARLALGEGCGLSAFGPAESESQKEAP